MKPENYWSLQWNVPERLKLRFHAKGVTIPFLQRDIRVYGRGAAELVETKMPSDIRVQGGAPDSNPERTQQAIEEEATDSQRETSQ